MKAGFDPLFEQAAQHSGVPVGLLRSVAQVESQFDPRAVGPVPAIGDPNDRAQGLMQIRQSNARAAGIDPFDPTQAIGWAANNLAQMRQRFGSWDGAVNAYHGGTDPANWGPRTAAYRQKVLHTLGESMANQQQPSNPGVDPFVGIGAASSAASAPPAVDPFAGLDTGGANVPARVDPFAAPGRVPSQPAQPQPMGQIEAGVRALGHHLMAPLHGAAQLVEHGVNSAVQSVAPGTGFAQAVQRTVDSDDAALGRNEAQYQATVPNGIGTAAGATIGTVAPLLLSGPAAALERIGGTAASPLTALAGRLGPGATRWLANAGARLTSGAAQGAGIAALTPATGQGDFVQQKADQLQGGALAGAAGVLLGAVAGRLLNPVVQPAVQRLLDAGVRLTPGQAAGGVAKAFEGKLTSVPMVGDWIKGAQQRGIDSFNVAVANRALEPIGRTVPGGMRAGSELNAYVPRAIGEVYDSVQPRAAFIADTPFMGELTTIRTQLSQDAPAVLQQFDNIVENQITRKLNNTAMSGDQWGDTRSSIGRFARDRMTGNATPDDRALSGALMDLQTAVNGSVGRNSPPDVRPAIDRANAAWAQYKQMEKAAGSVGAFNHENVFTPGQYAAAARSGMTNAQRAQGGAGRGLNAQFAQDGMGVLANRIPDSGTAGRLGAAGAVGALAGNPALLLSPYTALGGLAALAYTPLGQRVAAAAMTARPAAVRAAGARMPDALPRMLGTSGGILGTDSDGRPQVGGLLQ
ncbi:MAG: transglycosylase SLT domain-containing protein [Burkholderia gladioli]